MKNILLICSLILTGCATTNITSFTDPNYTNKKFDSYVVVTPNLNLEYSSILQKKICAEIIAIEAKCTNGLDLFPPTRDLSGKEKSEIMRQNKIDAYLIVLYSGGNAGAQHMQTLSYGSVNVYGNAANLHTTSMPVYSYSRRDGYDVVLIDTITNQKVWVGGAKVHAQGLANITDDVFTTSLSKALTSKLQTSGHL